MQGKKFHLARLGWSNGPNRLAWKMQVTCMLFTRPCQCSLSLEATPKYTNSGKACLDCRPNFSLFKGNQTRRKSLQICSSIHWVAGWPKFQLTICCQRLCLCWLNEALNKTDVGWMWKQQSSPHQERLTYLDFRLQSSLCFLLLF